MKVSNVCAGTPASAPETADTHLTQSNRAVVFGHIIQVTGVILSGLSYPLPWFVLPVQDRALAQQEMPLLTAPITDLFWTFTDSAWNTIFKIIFLGSSAYTLYVMLNDYKPTLDPNLDTFRISYLTGASAVLAIVFPYKWTVSEMLWAFSIWLESVAILPQLFMLQRTGEAETITTHYLFALGIYRTLYIPNWIYRYFAEGHFDPIPVMAGIVQTVLYSDFFWVYYTK